MTEKLNVHTPEPATDIEKPVLPEWETLAVKAEYSNHAAFFRELLQTKKRVTY